MTGRHWLVTGTAAVLVVVAFALPLVFGGGRSAAGKDPWSRIPAPTPHTDHSPLIEGTIATGRDATRACISCHPAAARDLMRTSHWTWLGHEAAIAGRTESVRIGKRNLINNYCIGIQSNWELCTTCHAGYGWRDETFDFDDSTNVDCLVCHDQTGTYYKSGNFDGGPGVEVDLTAVARSVGSPRRRNCGYCHFKGGGGDAVKHGDLDGTFYFPLERTDVHMGKYNFECIDCHRSERHELAGRGASISADEANRLDCSGCHGEAPHADERLNAHVKALACQTCHIPKMAVGAPTKMTWDWSTAGRDDIEEDPHHYLKIKGSFTYAQNVPPEYYWYNHRTRRYLLGDRMDPDGVTALNYPDGDIQDPRARIWPFKVHRGKQIYDKVYDYFLVPKTVGAGGYWTDFDWDEAARLGSRATGLAYSGQYGFARSDMYWPITHMVASKEHALQCTDCHDGGGRMDWERLGYDGDPAYRGSPRPLNTGTGAAGGNVR